MKNYQPFHIARTKFIVIALAAATALSVSAIQASSVSAVRLVKDINPGPADSRPDMFNILNGIAYFRADDGTHGIELWRSDGTETGTQLGPDLRPGAANGFPDNIGVADGSLYFTAFDTPTAIGSKAWRSDGSATGTVLLTDTFPALTGGGPFGAPLPQGFSSLNANTVLFSALDSNNYLEPWKTDGTAAGTMRLKDLHPGPEGSVPVGFTVLNGIAYFTADDSVVVHDDGSATYNRELFRTDGTEAGTYRVKDINPGPEPSIPFGFIHYRSRLYFSANDGAHGTELWSTDGTDAGTAMVADVNPGPVGSLPENLVLGAQRVSKSVEGNLLFTANDGTHGAELFVSNGGALTHLLKDINATGDSLPMHLTPFKDLVFFSADDGVNGNEPWVTNGTEEGTHLFIDINPGQELSGPEYFTVVGDKLFFVSISPGEVEFSVKTKLWVTDGTANGTELVYEEPGSSFGYAINNLTAIGDHLLFTAPKGVDADGFSTDLELYAVSVIGSKPATSQK